MFNFILKNDYIRQCDSSTFTVLFNQYISNNKINFIHALISYPQWKKDTDIFQYVVKLEQLKNDPKTYFLFDASTEGFSPDEVPFFDVLYYNCKKYKISPKKIIFVSSNMLDNKNILAYNKTNKVSESIRVFNFLSFKKMISDLIEDEKISELSNTDKFFNYFYKRAKREYRGEYFLSLSRVNRPHRIMASYLLCQSELSKKALISHNSTNKHEIKYVSQHYNIDRESLDNWCKHLPLIIDTDDFDTNHALTINSHLHHRTLFQVVNETLADNVNNTSLFYSEKTFRTIAHMQPFIIFGQKDCNKKLEDFGFRLYHNLFDYSFDSIADEKERYIKLLESVSKATAKLDKMDLQKQIEWRFSVKDLLIHNFKILTDISHDKPQFIKLYKQLRGK